MGQIFTSYGKASGSKVWQDLLIEITLSDINKPIHFLTAGKKGEAYFRNVRSFDRQSLISLPILSKFDSSEEFKISQWWLEQSANEIAGLYKNWLPRSANIGDFLTRTKIPYIPYFSYGEKWKYSSQNAIT